MEDLFYTVLSMSQTGSAVILAVLLTRLLLHKAPRKYSYALWGLAAFRLICPVSLSLPVSVLGVLYDNVDAVSQGAEGLVTAIRRTDGLSITMARFPEAAAENRWWLDTLPVIWLAGMAVLLLYALVSWWLLRHRMETAIRLEGDVYQSDKIRSPFILGLFRPRIYIPFGMTNEMRHYVLAHERHHLKRLDHWVRALAFVVLAVHWFNPLCWAAFYYMTRDMEMSCDEGVLSKEPDSAKDYSTALLSVAANRRFPSPSPLAFGETGVEQRIRRVLDWKKPGTWVAAAAAAVCLAVALLWGTNPPALRTPYPLTSTISMDDLYFDSTHITVYTHDSVHSVDMALSDDQLARLLDALNRMPESDIRAYGGEAPWNSVDASIALVYGDLKTAAVQYGDGSVHLLVESTDPFDDRHWLLDNAELVALMEELYAYVWPR